MKSLIINQNEVYPILEGRQTILIRPLNPQPPPETTNFMVCLDSTGPKSDIGMVYPCKTEGNLPMKLGPGRKYGNVGEWYFGKETWAPYNLHHPRVRMCYKAGMMSYGNANSLNLNTGDYLVDHKIFPEKISGLKEGKWKSPVHMPQWAARIFFEIDSIRICKIEDVTEEEAKEIGVNPSEDSLKTLPAKAYRICFFLNYSDLDWEKPWIIVRKFHLVEV
jgi:hypothetical protein